MIRAVALAALLLAVATAAVALPERGDARPPRLAVARATAPLSHSNSRDGQAILTATGLRPGERRSGEVTIRNHGGAGDITLATRAGGPLAERLRLSVTDAESGDVVLDAPLASAAECTTLGRLSEGVARTYRFTVTFRRGSDDNAYAGAGARADFEWSGGCGADAASTPEPATPDPTAPPPAPAPPAAPTPAAPPIPAAPAASALVLGDTRLSIDRGPYRFAARTGTARVGVRCIASAAGSCAGRLELERRQPGRGRGIAMAVGRFRIAAGKRRTITLKLNARARRRIATTGLVPVRAYVTVTDAHGRRHRAAYRDQLRWAGSSSRRKATSST